MLIQLSAADHKTKNKSVLAIFDKSIHNFYTSSALLNYVYTEKGYYVLGTRFTIFKGIRILSSNITNICSSP